MALRNVFGALGLDATLQAIRDRLPAALVGGRLPVDGSGVTQPVSGPLTDTQLRASAVPVTGPLTNTQLRASAVPVSGTFWQTTQPVSGPLTDAQLRATPPTVTANAGTNLNTSALAVESGGNLATAATLLGSIDTKTPTPQSGAWPVGDNGQSLTVDGRSGSPAVAFNRPADSTPYGATDVIGSAATANHEALNAGANGSLIQIISASLLINLAAIPSGMTTFRMHIWDSQPTAIADNAAFATTAADRARYCGWVDLAQIFTVGNGFLFTFGDYMGRPIRLTGTSFWFNLAMTGPAGHTPSPSTEYRVRFHCIELGG